ncbi:4-hydroxy-tetrahydrodipicolinate synthase [Selenomonas sp. TAMA-11512]|uniref:4-hydroxy-tetrahydrodipicolinate synthase n=1 Tax=Selenomonas sp. TAMA-11512 TaxID=3095337 RepID=UPI0030894C46|nr:4-hydroxy-tetrahydrodipicolinate synthase [Selenomonas sp. TAMA-11512]
MKEPVFRGAGVAIITPFTEDGINFDVLGEIIEDQIKGGTDAIIITGTTGESATMSDEEHRAAIKYAVDKVAGRIPVVAGTGSNETRYAIELSTYAAEVGADGLLLVSPYYNKATQKGLIAHFTAIADAAKLPCIIYNIPSRAGVNVEPETLAQLSKHPFIYGVKEASGNLSAIAKIRYLAEKDFAIYSGNDDQILPILSIGGQGVISVLSNVAPKPTHDMCRLYFDGKAKEAGELQIAYLDLINALFIEVNPIPVKAAMKLMGYNAGPLRLPLTPMEEVHLEVLKTAMKKHGII